MLLLDQVVIINLYYYSFQIFHVSELINSKFWNCKRVNMKQIGRVFAILPSQRESYWLADAIIMTNANVAKWKHCMNKNKISPSIYTYLEKKFKKTKLQ